MNAADEQLLGSIVLASLFAGIVACMAFELIRVLLIKWARS